MEPLPSVPGLTLVRPLSTGVPGPPWRARDLKSGYDVVVRPLPEALTAARVDDLIDALPEHPHLLRPSVHRDADDRPMLVTRFAGHRGLDQLLARRGGLAPCEVSTIALAVGRALAALHAAGLSHGAVRPSAIVLGADGRPFLDLAGIVPPAVALPPSSLSSLSSPSLPALLGSREATDDVVALARLLGEAVEAPVPAAMAQTLAAAGSPEPAEHMDATELVRRLVAAVPPEPLRLAPTTPAATLRPRPASSIVRGWAPSGPVRRRLALAVGAALALALAVVAGGVWAQLADRTPSRSALRPAPSELVPVPRESTAGASPTPSVAASPSASSPSLAATVDWVAELAALDDRRGEAFSTGDREALTDVDAPGSAALASDSAALVSLASAGVNASGFREVIRSVRPVSVSASVAVLRVVDERPAYALVRASDGVVVTSRAARAPASWLVELVRGAGGWQVRSVRPA